MMDVGCPSREMLCDYMAGRLPEADMEALADHIEKCSNCQDELATIEDVGDTFVVRFRLSKEENPYFREPQCQEALARAGAIVNNGVETVDPTAGQPVHEHPVPTELGDYRVFEKLGEGGMGAVYRAWHVKLGREVALKILPAGLLANDRAVARFEREMKAVGRLDHPNIVRAMDAREIEGTRFLVMEYVKGINLSKLVRRRGSLAVPDACEIVRHAALALHDAHEHGLIHRDVKPSNLMLTTDGQIKLLDLGLARFCHEEQRAGKQSTDTGLAIGTVDYMAPEQVVDSHTVDVRADIYSLGCTLYKLLTGQVPFSESEYKRSLDRLMARVHHPVPPIESLLPEIPHGLAKVVHLMLERNPDDRCATAAEVASALEPFVAGCDLPALGAEIAERPNAEPPRSTLLKNTEEIVSSALTRTPGSQPRPSLRSAKTPRRRRRIVIATAIALCGLVLALGIIIRILDQEGRTIAVINAPEGAKTLVENDRSEGGPLALGAPLKPPPLKDDIVIKPEPLPWKKGDPLSKKALVTQPASLKDVLSWTVETRSPRGALRAVAFHPKGKQVACGGDDGVIRLWQLQENAGGALSLKKVLAANDTKVASLSWSPDGEYLASSPGTKGNEVRIWDPKSGRLLRTLEMGDRNGVSAVAWSPDNGSLACGCGDGTVYLWEMPSFTKGELKRKYAGRVTSRHTRRVTSLAWSPDGKRLTSGSEDGTVCVGDPKPSSEPRHLLHPNRRRVGGVAWSPDGQYVAAAYPNTDRGGPGDLRIWNWTKGDSFDGLPSRTRGYLCVAWSPPKSADNILAGGMGFYGDDTLRWDMATCKLLKGPEEPTTPYAAWSLAFSPDGRTLAAVTDDGQLRLCDPVSGKVRNTVPGHVGHVDLLAFSPKGNSLACGTRDGTILVCPTGPGAFPRHLGKASSSISAAAFSPEGKLLAVADYRNHVIVWNTESGTGAEQEFDVHTQPESLAFSPQGRFVAVGGSVLMIRLKAMASLWEVSAGFRRVRTLPAVGNGLAFSPDQSDGLVLAAGDDHRVKLLDLETGTVLKELTDLGDHPRVLAFSPDGKTLAVGDEGKSVSLWEPKSGQMLCELEGHNEKVVCLRWVDDGKRLISGSRSEVIIWDVASKNSRKLIPVDGGAISPDGRMIASRGHSVVHLRQLEESQDGPLRTILVLRDSQSALIDPQGHYCGFRVSVPDGLENELVYVIQTATGQETLTPDEFRRKYRRLNDPSKLENPPSKSQSTQDTETPEDP